MQLHELMNAHIAAVSANDYAADALALMRRLNLGWVFVLDRFGVAGRVFARDLQRLSEAVLKDRDVREFMATNVAVASPDLLVEDAERLLFLSRSECLAVVNDRRLLGVVTARRLLELRARRTDRDRRAAG